MASGKPGGHGLSTSLGHDFLQEGWLCGQESRKEVMVMKGHRPGGPGT